MVNRALFGTSEQKRQQMKRGTKSVSRGPPANQVTKPTLAAENATQLTYMKGLRSKTEQNSSLFSNFCVWLIKSRLEPYPKYKVWHALRKLDGLGQCQENSEACSRHWHGYDNYIILQTWLGDAGHDQRGIRNVCERVAQHASRF